MCACPSAFAGTTWSFVAGLVLRTIPERRSAWGGQSASVPIILIGTEMVGTAQVRLCPPYGFNFQTATFYTDTASRSRRACARVLLDVLPLRNQRAWGMPGARCTRSLVCSVLVEHTSVVTTGPPDSPGIPARNGFNGFLRALPGDRACLSPSLADKASLRPVGATCLRKLAAGGG